MNRRRFLSYLAISGLAGVGAYLMLSNYPPSGEDRALDIEYRVVAEGLTVPWSIVPLDTGRYLVTERIGRLTYIDRGRISEVGRFDVYNRGEAGLLGIAIDPDFESNRWIYLYMSYSNGGGVLNKVVRYRLDRDNRSVGGHEVVVDGIPGADIHDGGRIKFGPDGYLYITTGDAAKPELAQDIDSLAGKILRVNSDGSIPSDNPFGNAVYSYGHRNPQGIDWHPVYGYMLSSEHGPVGHDEINLIVEGGNYGWPIVTGSGGEDGYIDPVYETGSSTIAPSGASFISGDALPEYDGWFAVACLRGEMLALFEFNSDATLVSVESLFRGVFGRIRDVVLDLDGSILILTSNRDGRGSPRPGDDKVIRIG